MDTGDIISGGIHGAPWWASWVSGFISQGGIAFAQYLAHLDKLGIWAHIAGLAATAVVGVAMAYGPGSTGRMVLNVGKAMRRARGVNSIDLPRLRPSQDSE